MHTHSMPPAPSAQFTRARPPKRLWLREQEKVEVEVDVEEVEVEALPPAPPLELPPPGGGVPALAESLEAEPPLLDEPELEAPERPPGPT